jgi:hypothetical protein
MQNAVIVDAVPTPGGRYGLQTMCERGGRANAKVIEGIGNDGN